MPATVLTPLKYFAVSMPATIASTSLSTLLKAHLGLGIVSSTPFWVVPSQESQGVPRSSATGPSASVTPVEMPPSTASTLSWRMSLRSRSTVSFGFDSSSTMSCTGRPRIPPALFTRSSHHSVERSPAAPTGAAIPARIVSTPIFTGPPACANTGAASRRTVAAAAPAPMSLSKLRRVVLMASSLRVRASFPAAFYHTSARAWLGEVVEAEIEPVQAGGSMIVVDFAMQVRFWGTRGSIATPGAATAVYGGNTSCTEVRAADGTVIVLDCGTGVRGLGLHLVRTMPQPMRLHLFIGHTHWDHIQGFPFFIPAFLPGAELNIYAPRGFQRSLEEAMSGQMEYSYFPVKLRELRSRIHYTELDEGLFRVGEVRVETQYLNHTGPTIGYRLSSGGATLAYMTDHEPFWSLPGRVSQHPGDERHIAFMRGADLVIHDAQYTEEEYRSKVGWGHSPLEYAVDVALAAGARRLALFHHDPQHDDTIMERIESEARARAVSRGAALEVLAAREGLELELSGNGSARDVGAASALQHRQIAGGRVRSEEHTSELQSPLN